MFFEIFSWKSSNKICGTRCQRLPRCRWAWHCARDQRLPRCRWAWHRDPTDFIRSFSRKNHEKNHLFEIFSWKSSNKSCVPRTFFRFYSNEKSMFFEIFSWKSSNKICGISDPTDFIRSFSRKNQRKKNICSRFFLENLRIKANNSVFLNILWVIRNEDLQFVAEEEEEELEDPNIYLKLRQDPITRVGELNSYSPNTLTIII